MSQRQPALRRRPAPRARARGRSLASLTRTNVVLAIAGGALLATALLYKDSRGAPFAMFALGLPLFLAQVASGLLPAAFCVGSERVTGASRLRLLVPAISGPLATLTACVLSWLSGSMC